MIIKHFYHPPTFTLSYLVWDEATMDAVLIDSVLDYDPTASQTSTPSADAICEFIEAKRLKVHALLETHAHADHLSGAALLKKRLGAKTVIGEHIKTVQRTFKGLLDLPEGFATDGRQFDHLLSDGEVFEAGSLKVKALHTPGHTPACTSYLIGDAVFTGDSLFLEDFGSGRCDFPGGDAEALYASIHDKLYALADDTRVFVGHDYQPGGRALRYQTTIGHSKAHNKHVRSETTCQEFVAMRRARDAGLQAPRLLFQSVQVNINGGRIPAAADNGVRFLKLPLNLFAKSDDFGEPIEE